MPGTLPAIMIVSLICETILKDQITQHVLELGATGYTCVEASGDGSRGAPSVIAGENLKLDVVCPPTSPRRS